eukprot:2494175-Heterocapsa_arctica.AAC.1
MSLVCHLNLRRCDRDHLGLVLVHEDLVVADVERSDRAQVACLSHYVAWTSDCALYVRHIRWYDYRT